MVLLPLPLALLGTASWLGGYVRPSADEWCFLPTVRDNGISGLVEKFYTVDNGRVGNGLLVGLYTKSGATGHQWFAPVSAVVVLGVLWTVTGLLLRAAGRTAPRGVPLLVASMVTVVFLLATPNTYKTFYWPASSVSHTAAPVLACAAAIPLRWARSRTARAAAVATAFLAGCFIGTLSEEASAVALVVLTAVLLLSGGVFTARVRRYARAWCLAGLTGTGAGALVLLTSPGSRNRRERFGAGTASAVAPDSLLESLRAFLEILGTVLTTWQYLGAVAVGVLLGLCASAGAGGGGGRGAGSAPVLLPRRPLFLVSAGTLTFLVAGYLCTVITYPLFGSRVTGASRTWNDYLLLYVLLLTGIGVLLGRACVRGQARARERTRGEGRDRVRRRARGQVRRRRVWPTALMAAACAAACGAVCFQLASPLAQLGHDMRVRAERWDRQDLRLRTEAARGARIVPYTRLPISGMGEPFGGPGPRTWPAGCVADYYHLERITDARRLP
ncbi:DUF6056 family protein [Streptomyces sp. NPDC088341]|uniref:DUF6056 family protein n=1 Tax=Streptomyces sp. NPDC088341 TaxID=3154870 RepID=UPI00344A4130